MRRAWRQAARVAGKTGGVLLIGVLVLWTVWGVLSALGGEPLVPVGIPQTAKHQQGMVHRRPRAAGVH